MHELPKVIERREDFHSFLYSVFLQCLKFLIQNIDDANLPQFTLKLVHTHEQFLEEEQRESESAAQKEVARVPSLCHAFRVGSKFRTRIYIDLQHYIDLLTQHGYPTFILNIVETYFHEILHAIFPQKYEQEIYDIHCPLLESFLGIILPEEKKKLKASDYYSMES